MATVESKIELSAEAKQAVRDLILVLADSKRVLGMRYAEWILGAPELEAGIACASMAQDEWGHGRLLYALLKGFDEDVDALEHGREPGEYRSMEILDRPPAEWPDLVALHALADTALAVQCEALQGSSFEPLAQRVAKLLEEEQFHYAHCAAWFKRLARANDRSRERLAEAVRAILPDLLRWFGPDSELARMLRDEGVMDAMGGELRERFLGRVGALLDELGPEIRQLAAAEPDFDGFDEAFRRASREGPDAETVAKIRGDKNAAFRVA